MSGNGLYCAAVLSVVVDSASGFSQGNAAASSPCGDQRSTIALASLPRVCSASLSPVQRWSAFSQVKAAMTTGPALVEIEGDIVAHLVERAGLVADGGAGFAGVEGFKVARQAVAVLLIAQHAEDGAADFSVGGERGGVVEGEMAGGDPLHDGGHFAGRGFAEAEFRLIGRHGLGGGHVDLLVEHGLVQVRPRAASH